MATVGQQLTLPESGWKRIDNSDLLITYSGTWANVTGSNYYNSTFAWTSDLNANIKFNFTGTRLRLIGVNDALYSNDITIVIDNVTYKMSQYKSSGTTHQVLLFDVNSLADVEHSVVISYSDKRMSLDAVDIDSTGLLKSYSSIVYKKKALIFNEATYKYYLNKDWVDTVSPVSGQDYLDHGMDDITIIPESAWSQLTGEVELCYYTDDPTKTEASFNIETEPFTLEEEWADKNIEVLYYTDDPNATESVVTIETDPFTLAEEWEDKEIKIIEYTDDPDTAESTITLETEPFTLYDELGDSIDVLYYTDDPNKTSAELNYTANYSPLDEIEGDFDVVIWTNDEEVLAGTSEMTLTYNALPFEQLLVQQSDVTSYGDLKSLVASLAPNHVDGRLRFIVSLDSGSTWMTYRFDKWRELDVNNLSIVRRKGMDIDSFNKIPLDEQRKITRIGYYLDDSEHYENNVALQDVKMVAEAPRNGVEVNDLAFYLLNTTATINLTFLGNKLKGVLDDVDKGKVRYRVILNGNPYFPANGQFTQLQASPFDINFVVDDRMINFGVDNTLKVEFEDYWGQTDSWIVTFVGTHSGLVFTDEGGNFFTTAFGEVLKYLDFGQIIAGQTTIDQKVLLKNNIGYDVKNISLTCIQPSLNGVEVELSKQQSPFIALPELLYPDVLKAGDQVEFAVRISTIVTADETPSGKFEIRMNADRA